MPSQGLAAPARVAILGASGFAGGELLRLCAAHPQMEVLLATGEQSVGRPIAEVHPGLAAVYDDHAFVSYSPDLIDNCDLVFCGLPHGTSQTIVPEIRSRAGHIVDLAADFRLADPDLYPLWYGKPHTVPELLDEFVLGLPELFRSSLVDAELIAAPGCYVTAATLALAPLVAAAVMEPTGIIVDAASGVSGAGRPPKPNTTFCAVDEDFSAYGLLDHRHTPEMEMAVARHAGSDVQILFTPHLAPMNRGILATCYGRRSAALTTSEVLGLLSEAYAGEPFIVVSERPPSTKATLGSNSVHISARVDRRTSTVIVMAALDNLVKGASGQAVQCANLALGIPETTGLSSTGLYP